jgi:hypothetical protein
MYQKVSSSSVSLYITVLASQFSDSHESQAFLSDTGIRLIPSNEKVLSIAGKT